MPENSKFNSPSKGAMNLSDVIADIYAYMHESDRHNYKVIIGTDSQVYTRTDFITAVVIRRVGAGGRYFWMRDQQNNYKTLRERIYMETMKSIDVAGVFSKKFYEILNNEEKFKNFNIEIHVDVGEVGPTREMIKEVVGMVRGNGYEVKIKPFSFGAFVVADHHT
jgi:predicted RNase H-related nuclease YkuK (DUF458 family)